MGRCRYSCLQQEAVNPLLKYWRDLGSVLFVWLFSVLEVFELISVSNTDVSGLLCSCRVLRSAQPGLAEPPGEEEAGLHPRAHRYRGQIRDRPADSAGGNGHQILCVNL